MLDGLDDVLGMGEIFVLQHRTERRTDIQSADPLHGSIQLIEKLFGNLGREFTGIAAALDLFADNNDIVSLGNRSTDGVPVQRRCV